MRNFFSCLFTLLVFVSCETVVQVNLQQGPKRLVSESYLEFSEITGFGSARVYLTETSPFYGDSNPIPISGAQITINDSYILVEDADSLGFYISELPIPYLGETSFVLDIQAEIDGLEGHWTATDQFTNLPLIDDFYYTYNSQQSLFQDPGYFVNVMFTDPIDEVNFYHFSVEINDSLSFELTPGTKRSSILKDEFINGQLVLFPVNDTPLKLGDHLKWTVSSMSEYAYNYYFNMYTLLTETSGVGAASPFPLQGNISSMNNNFDNALGIFQVRSKSIREITIED
jgi:hypothetical protein